MTEDAGKRDKSLDKTSIAAIQVAVGTFLLIICTAGALFTENWVALSCLFVGALPFSGLARMNKLEADRLYEEHN